jgi:hypothetical protein
MAETPLPKASANYKRVLAKIHDLSRTPAVDLEDQVDELDNLLGDLYSARMECAIPEISQLGHAA